MSAPVVAGVDDRPATLRAVAWAAHEAERRRLPLHLVATVAEAVAGGAPAVRRAHAALVSARRVALGAAAVTTSTEVAAGRPEIVLADRSRAAALVVVGARTPDGPGALTVGTVSSFLVTHAACPVVTVPGGWDPERRHDGEVVAALDPSGADDSLWGTVSVAADVARRWGRPLLAAVALPGAHTAADVTPARLVLDACHEIVVPEVALHEVVCHGDATDALLRLVGPSTGLLVLGARGTATSGLTPMGPVCQAVLARATCPVAVVPGVVTPVSARSAAPATQELV